MRRTGPSRLSKDKRVVRTVGAVVAILGLVCLSVVIHPMISQPQTGLPPPMPPRNGEDVVEPAEVSPSSVLGEGKGGASVGAVVSSESGSIEDLAEISFEMGAPFAKAWKASSKRDTFTTRVTPRFGSGDAQQPITGTATFYGKSSLKLGYTTRRSLDIKLNAPFGSDVRRFVLLSLWEDKYRLAYISAVRILAQFNLFFPHAQLVLLKCTGAAMCSKPLGVYLLLEYPSEALQRALPTLNPAQRTCEDTSSWKQRIQATPASKLTSPTVVSVGARNWFYFEKPPVYDVLDVPSFNRNATALSRTYRAVEKDPLLAKQPGAFFDLNMYMVWLVVNSVLMNGDYDDEVFFYSLTSPHSKGAYYSVMAWDYDSIFSPCHRKGKNAIRNTALYCAETPLERSIIDNHKEALTEVAKCVLGRVNSAMWTTILEVEATRLEQLLKGPGVAEATFTETTSIRAGQRELAASFEKQWMSLAKAFGVDVSDVTANTKPTTDPRGVHDGTECDKNTVKGLRNGQLKAEFKQSMRLDSISGVSVEVYSPTSPTPVPAVGYQSVEGGMHCAVATCDGSGRSALPLVLREKERGKAEFAVWRYEKPPVRSTWMTSIPDGSPLPTASAMCPTKWIKGIRVPILIALVDESGKIYRENFEVTTTTSENENEDTILVRGYSAVMVAMSGVEDLKVGIPALKAHLTCPAPTIESGGEVVDWRVWRAGSSPPAMVGMGMHIHIEGEANVPRGTNVTIPPGSIIKMSKGASITVFGTLILDGTRTNPISVVGESRYAHWTTILAENGGVVQARFAFVTGAGSTKHHEGTGHHHKHSSAFTASSKGSSVSLVNCVLTDLKGPGVTAGGRATVHVENSVIQWAEMGVECVQSDFTSFRSTWSHFPSATAAYQDDDNDGLYLSGGRHVVAESIIAHTKDDGIDSGTPEGSVGDGGSLEVTDTIIEMTTHEAIALSSSPKGTRTAALRNVGIAHSQQGVEMGYAGPGCKALLEGVSIYHTHIALRYGDNYYNRRQEGFVEVVMDKLRLAGNGLNSLSYARNTASAAPLANFRASGTPNPHIQAGTVSNPCYKELSLGGLVEVSNTTTTLVSPQVAAFDMLH